MQAVGIRLGLNKDGFLNAALNGDKRRVKKFLDRGFCTDIRDENGRTALYLACQGSHTATVSVLVERLADANSRCFDGSTPVHVAGLSGNVKIITKLINTGGDLRLHDYRNRSVYEWASKNPDEKKKKKMQAFLLKQRLLAMSYSPNCKDLKSVTESNPAREEELVSRYLKANWTPSGYPVFSLGFGAMLFSDRKELSMLSSISLVPESSLKHDEYGCTYNNGPFIVMESMNWGDTKVTVKRLHTFPPSGGCVDLLIRECKFISKLRHSSIMLLMGLCQTIQMDGLILIFERIHYGSLFSLIYTKAETLSTHEMCMILCQISDAVAYLHQRKLLHCCITSHAIHMISRSNAKLGNFEYMIENEMEETPPVALVSLLENRYMNATYNWMAPEVMAGNPITDKSDLYSLTCVLWELVHGRPPWSGMDAGDIEVEVLRNQSSVPVRDSIQNPFHCLLQYGLAPDLAQRQLTVTQLRDILHGFIMDEDSQGVHHMTCTSLSLDPGDPSACNTDFQPQSTGLRSSEVSLTDIDEEVFYSQEVTEVDMSKPWSFREADNETRRRVSSDENARIPKQGSRPTVNVEEKDNGLSDVSDQATGNDTTLKCEDSRNSRDMSTQTFAELNSSKKVHYPGIEEGEELIRPELPKTDYPKSSTPNKVPPLNLNQDLEDDSLLRITDEDIEKVFSEVKIQKVDHNKDRFSENETKNVVVEENIEITTEKKALEEIPDLKMSTSGNMHGKEQSSSSHHVMSEEETKDHMTESDSQLEQGSRSRFSILSFLSSKSSKKSTDQDSAVENEGKGLRSLKKTKKKSSERNLKHKKAVTESSDDQTDSQYTKTTPKKGFLGGKKLRNSSKSASEKGETGDGKTETTLQRDKTTGEAESADKLHARLSCYKIDISGIDKLETEMSSKTQSENEEVQKVQDLKHSSSGDDSAKTGSGSSQPGNPFKKFVNADTDDIFTDEIKAILAKPMKMPKLPSQYSKTSLYSRLSVEKKPPSMAETLIRLYSPTNSHSNMKSLSHHTSIVGEKASTLPVLSLSHRGFSSPQAHSLDRSLSSAHSSRCDSSHLDASESNTSSVTVKPASHHVPKISPYTSHTEHFAFPRSPRENTQPGSVSAHAVLLKELQSYHHTSQASVSSASYSLGTQEAVLARRDGTSERERALARASDHISAHITSKLQRASGLAHQTSTVISPRQSYLTKPEVSPRNLEEERGMTQTQEKMSSYQTVDKGWSGPAVARAKFFGIKRTNEKFKSDTLVHMQQTDDRKTANIRSTTPAVQSAHNGARSPAFGGYVKSSTLPTRGGGTGVHATRIHSVKDMTASFQKQLEQHFEKQATLVKNKREGIPDSIGQPPYNRFITPQHLKSQTLPSRLNHVQVFTASGDQRQSTTRKISSLNIELQKFVGVPDTVATSQGTDPNGSFLNTSSICEQAYTREMYAASPAKCHRSSDENDEVLCSFVEDLVNTTHDEVLQEYTHKDCIHLTPVKPSTDTGYVQCQLNLSQSNNCVAVSQCDTRQSSGSCDSGSANRWQVQQKRISNESSISKKSDGDIEEFYFDDIIHPDLWKERHMRLQSTLGLDGEASTSNTKSESPEILPLDLGDKGLMLDTPTFPSNAVSSRRFKFSRLITRVTEDEGEDTEHKTNNLSNNSDVVDV